MAKKNESADQIEQNPFLRFLYQAAVFFVGATLMLTMSGQVSRFFFPDLGTIPGLVMVFLSFHVAYCTVFIMMAFHLGLGVIRLLFKTMWRAVTPFVKRPPSKETLTLGQLSRFGIFTVALSVFCSVGLLSAMVVAIMSIFAEATAPLLVAILGFTTYFSLISAGLLFLGFEPE